MKEVKSIGTVSDAENLRIITPDGEFLVKDVELLEFDMKCRIVTVKINGYVDRYKIDKVKVELV